MSKTIKSIIILSTVFAFVATLTACSRPLNKQEKDAVRTFGDVMAVLPAEEKDGWFQLTAPDNDAKFVFSNDCVWMAVDAAPFIAAGMDAATLENIRESIFYKSDIGFSLPGWDMLNRNVKDTALAQFEADIRYFKVAETDETFRINFADDHNTRLDSAVFEWAKDIEQGECDVIFTLNAEPLIAAGVQPEKVEGWEPVQISVEVDGKIEQVWRFRKSFDLRRR